MSVPNFSLPACLEVAERFVVVVVWVCSEYYRVSQKNGTPHCGLICRLSLSFYNLIDTGPFFCVYQEKSVW